MALDNSRLRHIGPECLYRAIADALPRFKHLPTQINIARNIHAYYVSDIMILHPPGTVAVIFCSTRTGSDDAGYDIAASKMSALAAQQPGYLGADDARNDDGMGITISYWEDDASAKAWRDHPEHIKIRHAGRDIWYQNYTLHVARIERSYDWQK